MATTSISSSPVPRRRLGLRYSLRALLILLTLSCLGVAYWYRWPYRHVVEYGPQDGSSQFWLQSGKPFRVRKEVQRFRRVLRGDPIREGKSEHYDDQGRLVGEEYWREGERHGPSTWWFTNGQVREKGQFSAGKPDGLWEYFDETGKPTRKCRYVRGTPEGTWEWLAAGKVIRTATFSRGEVTHFNGQKVTDFLRQAAAKGEIANRSIKRAIDLQAQFEFFGTPVKDVADYVAECYGIYVCLDRRSLADAGISPDVRVSEDVMSMSLSPALVVMLEPHGLAPTYRFDSIWITTKEDAETWRDRTGIPELTQSPPPGATADDGRRIERELDRQAVVELVDVPLQDALEFLSVTYALTFACEGVHPKTPINSISKGLSLRSTLGAILDQHALRIRWKEGTTLVVEPEEGAK